MAFVTLYHVFTQFFGSLTDKREEMIPELKDFIATIKVRVISVFLIVHLGLGLGIYALARNSAFNGWDQTSSLFLAGVLCLYLGFFLGVFFIVWPILPWLSRARKVEHWTQRLIHDLPAFLEQLPKIIAAIQTFKAAWDDSKKPPIT
jgi:ABC-type dipeptide/oligopeptide/nickel transport system permease component